MHLHLSIMIPPTVTLLYLRKMCSNLEKGKGNKRKVAHTWGGEAA